MSALVWVAGRAGDVGDERYLVTRQAPLPFALWQSGVRAALGTRDRQLVAKFTCKDVNPILSDTMRHIYEFVVA